MAGRSGFGPTLRGVFESFHDLSPIMDELAEIIDASVQENFDVGGRYGTDNEMGGGSEHWRVSQRARRQNGQTLIDEGRLRGTFKVRAHADGVSIGSNLKYAAIHHFGGAINHPGGTPYVNIGGVPTFLRKDGTYPDGTKFTRAHRIGIGARPWAVVQNEDLTEMNRVVVNFLRRKVQ